MDRKSLISAMYFIFHILLEILQTSAKVPAIIVFGDSSVDSGNNNGISTVVKSNFRPYGRDFYGGLATGRFSNGRVPSDFISEAFGIKPTIPAYLDSVFNMSDFSSGVCFASAGSGYDNSTSNVMSVIPPWKQMEYYKNYQLELRSYMGRERADNILKEALYLISAGTNDFLENYYTIPSRSLQYTVEGYQDFLIGIVRNFISELYGLGARKISLGGLPPMGCLPLERARNLMFGSWCVEKYNNVAKEFNGKLEDLAEEMNKELGGIQLVFSNPYRIVSDIVRNPESYGFENAVKACCGTGMFEMGYMCDKNNPLTCANASKFVFWDSFHPTEKAYGIVSEYIVTHYLSRFM